MAVFIYLFFINILYILYKKFWKIVSHFKSIKPKTNVSEIHDYRSLKQTLFEDSSSAPTPKTLLLKK